MMQIVQRSVTATAAASENNNKCHFGFRCHVISLISSQAIGPSVRLLFHAVEKREKGKRGERERDVIYPWVISVGKSTQSEL